MQNRMNDRMRRIVKEMIKDGPARRRRQKEGELTEFDLKFIAAMEEAREQMPMPEMDLQVRKEVESKVIDSIERVRPWEKMGDTYMGRRKFYELRTQFIFLVAKNMGMIDPARKDRRARKGTVG